MSKKSPISSKSSEADIYSFYSKLYDTRERKMKKIGFDMRAAKLDQNELTTIIAGERERNKEKKWSTDQIVRNLVSKETSKIAYGSAKGLRQAFIDKDIKAPEEWYDNAGKLHVPSVLGVRAWLQTASLDDAWHYLDDEYHRFTKEWDEMKEDEREKLGYKTAADYGKHKISQNYFGSK